jgi:hypothetical protein
MQIDLMISIQMSDRPRERDKIKAARQVLLHMAAEIIRASASWNGEDGTKERTTKP